jgi:hypothetical protein
MKKQNCWEFMGCSRNVSGFTSDEFGVCPAFFCKALSGIHDGMNGGRSCWMVTGTMCGNSIQGSYLYKAKKCHECDFFLHVKQEEGKKFLQPETLSPLVEREL